MWLQLGCNGLRGSLNSVIQLKFTGRQSYMPEIKLAQYTTTMRDQACREFFDEANTAGFSDVIDDYP